MNLQILGYAWFSAKSTIGIVLIKDETTEELKSYIASVQGDSEIEDLVYTHEWGAKFPVKEAISIITKSGTQLIDAITWINETNKYLLNHEIDSKAAKN